MNARKAGTRRRPAWGKIAAIALVTAALAAAWRYTPLAELVTAERILAWARIVRGTTWTPIAVVLAYTLGAFVMFPRPLLTLVTVIAFGPWFGFGYAMAGILAAALAVYYVGRILPEGTMRRLAGDKLDEVSPVLREHSFTAIFAASLVPTPPFAIQGAIAGAMRINVLGYSVGTLLGMLPGVLATTVFGNEIAAALEDPSKISYWLLGLVLVAFVAVTYFVRRWFVKQSEGRQAG